MNGLIFDSHAHYDDKSFDQDRDSLLSSFPEKGVGCVVSCGANLESSRAVIELAEAYPHIYAAVGVHPEDAGVLPQTYLETLKALAAHPKVVAVGEIGLDYYWEENPPPEIQKEIFAQQLLLAKELSLPVIIHDREAHGDTMGLLEKHRPKGVLHCFSGSAEMARQAVKLGLYLGFGGSVTFKNARHPVEAVKTIPLDRLLLETDAPYLSPVPFRGKRNDSTLIRYTAEKIAQIKELPLEQVLNAAYENACLLFGI